MRQCCVTGVARSHEHDGMEIGTYRLCRQQSTERFRGSDSSGGHTDKGWRSADQAAGNGGKHGDLMAMCKI